MKPALFAELCCGSAAVTLALVGGPKARPPTSYMGSKLGYTTTILSALGLTPGQGADAVLLCDPGPWSRVWSVIRHKEGRDAVVGHLRGWRGTEPRALWEYLRARAPLAGPTATALEVAEWLALAHRSVRGVPSKGFRTTFHRHRLTGGYNPDSPADYLERLAIHWQGREETDARRVDPVPGAVVYIDPPYQGTTGYAHDLPRADVLELARRWADAGATVAVSEAEPLPLPGWDHVEITGQRVGPRRTFSRQQREWLTVYRATQRIR